MADEEYSEGSSKALWIALAVVVGLTLALSIAAPKPQQRKYPHRKLVRFWHMWTSDWEKTVDKIVDRFNESQDVYEVVPLSIPDDVAGTAETKFAIAVAGDNPPDCMAQWNDIIPKWAESKLLTPLDEEMGAANWAQQKKSIYPAALRVGMYKDHLYGVTVGLNVWALYYRPDYFREAGLDPDHLPSTLEELEAWGHKMDRFDANGQLVRMGFLPEGYRIFAPVFGGGFFDWAQGHLLVDTPQNLKALAWLGQTRGDLGFDKVTRFESSLQAAVGTDWPLISGSYGMLIDGQWRVEEAKRFAPNFEYRTAPIPPAMGGLKNASFSNGNFMIIPSTAHDPEGAWEFIKFWSGLSHPERAAEFYTWGGWLPINRAVAQAPIYRNYVSAHPQFKTFVDLLDSPNIEPIPPVPYQVFFYDRLLNAEQSVESGSKNAREAMDVLVQEVNQELAHRKEFGYVDGQ